MEDQLIFHEYELTTVSRWGERKHTSWEYVKFLKALAGYAEPGADIPSQTQSYLTKNGVSVKVFDKIRGILIQ